MNHFSFENINTRSKTPVLDVRSPGEFALGHIPGAISFPLFSDEERAEVGTLYKQTSPDDALIRGLEFVGPKMASFIRKAQAIAPNKEVTVYCWRGGMRSGSMQWLLETAGFKVTKIPGGYKAYRKWVLETIVHFAQHANWKILGGMTGSAKTEILLAMKARGSQVIDLEGLANHKGSAFGHFLEAVQPTTEQFMNLLAKELCALNPSETIWMEDESRLIGRVVLPPELVQAITSSPIFVLKKSKRERASFLAGCYGEAEFDEFERSFNFIKKRLGGPEVQEALEAVREGNLTHAAEIALKYYDKAYQHSLDQRASKQIQTTINAENQSTQITAEILQKLEG